MNVLSGVYPYGTYSGDIVYKGEVGKFHKIKDSEAKGIVIIHQELALSPYMSVAENVFLGNEQCSGKGVIDWTKTRAKATEMLAKVGLEDEDVVFIKKFILASGSLKEMAGQYGVTYPTVRLRLDRLIQKIKLTEDTAADPYIATIKRLAMNEKLDLDTAKVLIAAYKKTRKEKEEL